MAVDSATHDCTVFLLSCVFLVALVCFFVFVSVLSVGVLLPRFYRLVMYPGFLLFYGTLKVTTVGDWKTGEV